MAEEKEERRKSFFLSNYKSDECFPSDLNSSHLLNLWFAARLRFALLFFNCRDFRSNIIYTDGIYFFLSLHWIRRATVSYCMLGSYRERDRE